jgi:hypothetical protein
LIRQKGVPEANWLPVPLGPFNIMLRVYGPEGGVADNTYVPPVSRVSDRTPVSVAQSCAKIPHPCAERFQSLDEEA